MADKHDDFENPIPRQAPKKAVVDTVLDAAIKAGSSMVSVLSGLLAAALILYSGYVLVDTFETERQASSSAWDLLQFRPELIEDSDIPLDSPDLQAINNDYRAWLTVYDTSIDYPVMQGTNDLYYASHDIYGRYSLTGSIYLAAANAPDFSDSYNVIFGHHMDSGAMFGGLDSFTDADYFSAHRTAILITPIGAFDITFFASAATDAYETEIYSYGDRAAAVVEFLRSGGGQTTTVFQFDEETAAQADRVVALSTCAADEGANGRLVVFGRMTEHIVYTDLTIEKRWDDNDDQDGIRPSSLTVYLTRDEGQTIERTCVLDPENGWTATAEKVPMNGGGKTLQYRWTEDEIPGYSLTGYVTEGSATVLTNAPSSFQAVTLTLQKVWDDDDDRDHLRMSILPVRLLADGETVYTDVLSDANGWQVSVTMPENRAGVKIVYDWEEDLHDGYRLEKTVTESEDAVSWTFTNIHEPELTERGVRKVWLDNDDQDGMRPDSLTVRLLANGEETGREVILSDENGWEDRITGLFVYDQGQKIEYTWDEGEVPDYKLVSSETDRKQIVTTLTNRHEPELIDLSIHKKWADVANTYHTRPESLTVRLFNRDEGTVVGTVELKPGNSWTGTVRGLKRYEAGREITYEWEEPEVEGYILTSVEPDERVPGRTMLTNTLIRVTEASVEKVWEDREDLDGARPETLSVTLLADGRPVTEDADGSRIENPMLLTAENDWRLTVGNLKKFSRTSEITYTWTEAVPEGYVQTALETSGGQTVFTNELVTERTVIKVWADDENEEGLRPESVTVTLLADGEPVTADAAGDPVAPVVLSDENGWTATVSRLPKYDGGREIVYSFKETPVEGYAVTARTEGTVTTLTNSTAIDQTIIKIWDDDNDRDGLRPLDLHVFLQANGAELIPGPEGPLTEDIILTAENHWTATVTGLPRLDENGEEIVYTWSEEKVEHYEPDPVTEYDAEHRITRMTNTRHVDTVSRTVVKIWNDDGDQDLIRPDRLEVYLLADGRKVTTYADGTPFENPVILREDASGNWTYTAENLPLNSEGRKIEYTWAEETVPEGYRLVSIEPDPEDPEGGRTIITNEHIPSQDMIVIKEWQGDIPAVRPASLEVTLTGGGRSWTIGLDAEGGWTGTVEAVPQQDENGDPIEYTWSETVPEGYTLVGITTAGNTAVIVNRRTIDLTVRKVWVDTNDAARPRTLNVVLTGGGSQWMVTLSENNRWTGTVTGLPQYDASGREITYTWTEPAIPGYRRTSQVTEGNVTTITNTRNTPGPGPGPEPPEYTLTIYYRYQDGTTAAETYTGTYSEGESYSIPSPEIPGYRASLVLVAGTMPGHDLVYTVIYVRDEEPPVIIDEPPTPLGLGQVYINVGDCLE